MEKVLNFQGLLYFYNKLCNIFVKKESFQSYSITSADIQLALGYTPANLAYVDRLLVKINNKYDDLYSKFLDYDGSIGSVIQSVDDTKGVLSSMALYINDNKDLINSVRTQLDASNAVINNVATSQDLLKNTITSVSQSLDASNATINSIISRSNQYGTAISKLQLRITEAEISIETGVSLGDVSAAIRATILDENGHLRSEIMMKADQVSIDGDFTVNDVFTVSGGYIKFKPNVKLTWADIDGAPDVEDYVLPTIDPTTKNWIINGNITQYSSKGDEGHSPYVNSETKTWMQYDPETGWVDTGIKAEGTKGSDGKTPTIGEDGYWYINGEYTGIKAVGSDGTSVNIKGSLSNTEALLNAIKGEGFSYLVDGDLWVYTANVLDDQTHKYGFENVGNIQGPTGAPGRDATTYYTWIKYADSASGSGISDSPTNKSYIGFAYNKTTNTESTNPSDYIWSLIKGEDGVPGQDGQDGVTHYTWIKYSDVQNPTSSLIYDTPKSTTVYIGIAINKTTAVESTNPSDYTWSKFKGDQGIPGKDGSTPTISSDGYWIIDGVKTSYSAIGDDGKPPRINANGYWEEWDPVTKSYQTTNIYAKGNDGKNGAEITSVVTQYTLYTKGYTVTNSTNTTWSTTLSYDSSKDLWTRIKYTWSNRSDGQTVTYTTPVKEEYINKIGTKTTYIGDTGIYSGTISADRITGLQISADKITAGTLSANIALNATQGTIGGWTIGQTSLTNLTSTTDDELNRTRVGTTLDSDGITSEDFSFLSSNSRSSTKKVTIKNSEIVVSKIITGKSKRESAIGMDAENGLWLNKNSTSCTSLSEDTVIKLSMDGSGHLANGNFQWDTDGNIYGGKTWKDSDDHTIHGFAISPDGLIEAYSKLLINKEDAYVSFGTNGWVTCSSDDLDIYCNLIYNDSDGYWHMRNYGRSNDLLKIDTPVEINGIRYGQDAEFIGSESLWNSMPDADKTKYSKVYIV